MKLMCQKVAINFIFINFKSIYIIKSPAMINSLLLSPKDAATDENSVLKAFICSFSSFGGLYIFPIVNVFAKLPPFTFIINPSQCSYELR